MSKADVITVGKKAVCPHCGMTLAEGAEMFRSLKMPNKYVCLACAIMEHDELRKATLNKYIC